jgi:hypothetical protein
VKKIKIKKRGLTEKGLLNYLRGFVEGLEVNSNVHRAQILYINRLIKRIEKGYYKEGRSNELINELSKLGLQDYARKIRIRDLINSKNDY